jgi:FdrA protein
VARVAVRRGAYYDSVALMLTARDAAASPGVGRAVASMATPLNQSLLRDLGFELADADALSPNDLLIAVRADDEATADETIAGIERALAANAPREASGDTGPRRARSLAALARRRPDLNVAFVSVPSQHAVLEASAALEAGLHVFCFSDGVDVDAEARLKRRAVERGLLFMGPDCGTAILDGVAFGFANAVRRGPVGIVAASGTGAQQISCLLDSAGVGVSHIIGVGGRDLSGRVGGLMCREALDRLARDRSTQVIIVVSKPPSPVVAVAIAEHAAATGKPVVLGFPGAEPIGPMPQGVDLMTSLEATAARAASLMGRALPDFDEEISRAPTRGWIRGLYSGGTLCDEAMAIVSSSAGPVASNIPLREEWRLADVTTSAGHTFIDFGDDELTEGRAHPMIDPTLRLQRIEREAADPRVSVILLDVVLGHGAHADPAGELAPVLRRVLAARPDLNVIAAVCGTSADPQRLDDQVRALTAEGVAVTLSNAHAARLALRAAGVEEGIGGRA